MRKADHPLRNPCPRADVWRATLLRNITPEHQQRDPRPAADDAVLLPRSPDSHDIARADEPTELDHQLLSNDIWPDIELLQYRWFFKLKLRRFYQIWALWRICGGREVCDEVVAENNKDSSPIVNDDEAAQRGNVELNAYQPRKIPTTFLNSQGPVQDPQVVRRPIWRSHKVKRYLVESSHADQRQLVWHRICEQIWNLARC